jgi:flagellar biosynthesis protein FlhF
MAKALADVKRDLGPSAVILYTRRFRQGGVLGLIGGRFVWEVQAAPNVNVLPRPPRLRAQPGGEGDPSKEVQVATRERRVRSSGPPPDGEATSARSLVTDVISEVLGLAEAATPATPPEPLEPAEQVTPPERDKPAAPAAPAAPAVPPAPLEAPDTPDALSEQLNALRDRLLEQEVDAEIADQVIDDLRAELAGPEVPQEPPVEDMLTAIIAKRITVRAMDLDDETAERPRLISVIGPTGVGKTTTIAKLAAEYKVRQGRTVGLITIDTYRIAAVEQLRTYAEILQVPIAPALTPGELHRAIHAMRGLDVVLIDTVGRSQNDELRLRELRRFLEAGSPQEVHLAISAGSSVRVAMASLERFAPLGVNGIIITKLDEATNFGMILNIASATDAGIVHVTSGQDVPKDIAPADPGALAGCIVKGSWNES